MILQETVDPAKGLPLKLIYLTAKGDYKHMPVMGKGTVDAAGRFHIKCYYVERNGATFSTLTHLIHYYDNFAHFDPVTKCFDVFIDSSRATPSPNKFVEKRQSQNLRQKPQKRERPRIPPPILDAAVVKPDQY